MQGSSEKPFSKTPIKGLLSHIIEQDHLWWESKDGSRCSPLLKRCNLIPKIHGHFQKLEREHCCLLIEESLRQQDVLCMQGQQVVHSHHGADSDVEDLCHTEYESSHCSDASLAPLTEHRLVHARHRHSQPALCVSPSAAVMVPERRTRHISEERTKPGMKHRPSLLHESLRLGVSLSPTCAIPSIPSSLEKMHNGNSDPHIRQSTRGKNIKPPDFAVYRAALSCCHYPVLARAQMDLDRSESDQSENEGMRHQWDGLSSKDGCRSLSERMLEYLRSIFQLSTRKHGLYQQEGGKKTSQKRADLQQCLLSQLNLLETGSNAYYCQGNFQSYNAYKSWQDRERREITRLLGGRIPRPHGSQRQKASKRDRCSDYKVLLKKVMLYELGRNASHIEDLLRQSGISSASESSHASYHGEDMLLGRNGRRLLLEFATRYRVAPMTQLCFYLEVAEECFQDGHGIFDNVTTFRTLFNKIERLQELIASDIPMCNSEMESLIAVTDNFIQRIKRHIMTLLTEWTPSTYQLQVGLELAEKCFSLQDTLLGESEWPVCLSQWVEAAIIDSYHSRKKPEYQATPWSVLLSVSHAVEVAQAMQKQEEGSLQTDYQGIFSVYIADFPRAVCAGLYEAVMTDVRFLAMSQCGHTGLVMSHSDLNNFPQKSDFLELAGIGLAYKLAEFESVVDVEDLRASYFLLDEEFSWRLYFHHLSMYWIDVLSCHMRKLVLQAIHRDDFSSLADHADICRDEPSREENRLPSTSYPEQRFRLGSLLRKDSISNQEESNGTNFVRERLSDVEESPESVSDSDTLEEDECTEVDIAGSGLALSSENVSTEENRSSCVLVSYKKLDMEDPAVSATSFQSCTTTDDSNRCNSEQSATTSRRSYHTPRYSSSNSVDLSDASTSIISGSTSSLPQLIPVPAPGQISDSDNACSDASSNTESYPSSACSMDVPLYNVSSSLVEVIFAMNRFAHFIQTIGDAVYCQPNQDPLMDESLSSSSGVNIFSWRNEARRLSELRETFNQKAVQVLCEIVQQYANNLISIEIPNLPREAAQALIGKRLMRQIVNGKYNKTILIESSMNIQQDLSCKEESWVDKGAQIAVTRRNNLLALQQGMPDLWEHIEDLLIPESRDYFPPHSVGTSLPSRNSYSSQSPNMESAGSAPYSDDDCQAMTGGSDMSQATSESTGTAIYLGGSAFSGDQNNNNESTEPNEGKITDEEGPPEPMADEMNTTACPRQLPDALVQDTECDFEAGQGARTGLSTPYMRIVWDYMKEKLRTHTSLTVKAMDGLLSYQAREWFGKKLDSALDTQQNRNGVQTAEILANLDEKLTALLDMLEKYVHLEGIEKVQEMLWLQITQDVKSKISSFRKAVAGMSKSHAYHILKVCMAVIRIWYKHPSKPNHADLDWLVKPLQPSLTLLELYCLPTTSLLRMYSQMCQCGDCDNDDLLEFPYSDYATCQEMMLLCMRDLQDAKTFSGEVLHRTMQDVIIANDMSAQTHAAPRDAQQLCQQMLDLELLKFSFKRKRDNSVPLPDLIPVAGTEEFVGNSPVKSGRTSSVSTGSSQSTSLDSEESYTVSNDSDNNKVFYAQPDYYYEFSQARLPMSIMDDMQQESDSPILQNLQDSFLVKLLLIRSKSDKAATTFLKKHGHLPRSVFASCFGCVR